MKKGMKRFVALSLSILMVFSLCIPASAQEDYATKAGTSEKINDTWYYYSQNDAEYIFEKVSHPDRGAGEIDGFLDTDDARSQSYAWSAIEYGDYIYVGTCYNSTYGIYWRNVFNMMLGLGKSQMEAMQIARDFVQFVFDNKFDETLKPHGVLLKFHKETGECSIVYDSKESADPAISATSCSGYRMAFEFHDKLYFVSLASPTMFLLEIDPEDNGATEKCEIAFQRSLSSEGSKKQIASGVHGLIVYDDEILMCLADEASDGSTYLDGKEHPEGGLIVASKDGRSWRVIADEDDLGPSAYHSYDGLMGGGIWDIIEYNGHVYVTVVTDLTDTSTGVVKKQGFALYRGTKGADGEFTWEMMAGDTSKEGVTLPYGFGTTYSMACNMWVYNGYLYLGTYNDPMLDFTAVADRGDFSDLYYDLFYSINLYRMDTNENIEMVAGKPNEYFAEVKGNMSEGFGDNANQYVWRMTEHDGKLFVGTYDSSVLASAFTQLTDGQLLDMTKEEYLDRLEQLKKLAKSLGVLQEKYEWLFDKFLGSDEVSNLFNYVQKLIDAGTGKEDPVPAYKEALAEYETIKDQILNNSIVSKYPKLVSELNKIFQPADQIFEEISSVVYYYGVNYYMKNATKGFDILVTEDGLNFEVVTNDGLGDPNNHGVRTLTSADNGATLFAGTANPYFGGQMWKTVDSVPTEEPEVTVPDAPTTEDITALKIPVEVVCDTAEEHVVNNTLAGENVTIGDVVETEGVFTVTLTVDVAPYVNEFNVAYPEPAHTQKTTETPSIILTWDTENNVWTVADGTMVTVEMQEAEAPEPAVFKVTFDAGENGTFAEDAAVSVEIEEGQAVGSENIPVPAPAEGYTFVGWTVEGLDVVYTNEQVAEYIVSADTTFTAVYQEEAKDLIKVEFVAGGNGTFAADEVTEYEIEKGTKIPAVPTAVADSGYTFAGWMLPNDGTVYSSDEIAEMTFDANTTITGTYTYNGGDVPEIEKVTVTFDAGENGQLVGLASHKINKGTTLATLPSVVADEGYTFTGWKAGEMTYSVDDLKEMVFTEDTTFTAVYSKDGEEVVPPEKTEVTDPNNDKNDTDTTNGLVDSGDHNNVKVFVYTALIAVATLSVVLVFQLKKRYKF